MDNAVAPTAPSSAATSVTTLVPATPGLAGRWQALPVKLQLGLVLGVAALLAVLVFMGIGARDADYRVLFPNLSDKDGGAVIERLTQMNVPYRFAEGGGTIMVPAGRVHELRMKLASAGLPSGGTGGGGHTMGYELLDKNSFGQTQGQERMKMQRAIEGELTTTIQALEGVKSARVHLALPNQNGFFREQQKPSASVVLNLHPGRTLDRAQIAGVVRLVSGSVPELAPKAVSVVDNSGALLSGPGDDEHAQGLDSQQLQFRREIEAGLLKRVIGLLEPVVGRDNVRATVTADLDFSQVMQTAESYTPNQGPDARAAVREQRSEDSSQPQATPAGVPGATSNQPPVPAQAPINGAAQPLQGAQGPAGAANATRREAATRFEVDKTTTVTKQAVGNVRRLSAAVVVNHKTSTDAKGKTSTVPLSEKEIEQLTALVQQGIGFNAERGDVVKIVNAPFRAEPAPAADETPLYQQPWLRDLLKSAIAPLALAVVALVIVFKLIKPALTQLMAPPPAPEPGSQVSEVVDDTPPPEPLQLTPPHHAARIEAARSMAKQNPAAVANIVRGWVNGEAS
jgi:flagellar M-ring protein FliF